jgi:predicted ester cyclase
VGVAREMLPDAQIRVAPSSVLKDMSNIHHLQEALLHFANPASREAYFQLYDPAVVLHGYDGVEPGLESLKKFYQGIWGAFPDARVEVEDVVEAGDKLAVRFTMTGTHQGDFNGVAATGAPFRLPGMTILRFAGGCCVERWSVADFLSLMRQLGALRG